MHVRVLGFKLNAKTLISNPQRMTAQDMPGLARLLLAVLVDRPLAARLAAAARATALHFSPTVIVDRLEAVLYGLAARSAELVGLRHAATHSIHLACAAATLACSTQVLPVCLRTLQKTLSPMHSIHLACAAATLACCKQVLPGCCGCQFLLWPLKCRLCTPEQLGMTVWPVSSFC